MARRLAIHVNVSNPNRCGINCKGINEIEGYRPGSWCGKMAEYVERFENGRFMASHGTVPRVFRAVGAEMVIGAAVICHGVQRV